MALLSDIAKGFSKIADSANKAIKKAAVGAAGSVGLTKESIEGANKAIQANPTLSAASQPGLSGLVATPKAIATEIVPLIGERFRTAQSEYEASGVKNPLADIVSTIGNAPVLFGEGVAGVIDEGKNVLQKVKSGTDVAMSVAQTNPWTAAWNVAYEGLVPADIKKTVNDSISGVTEDATKFGVDNGLSQENAAALAGIAQNVIGVAASIFGIKGGNVTGASLRKAALPSLGRKGATQLGTTANIATNALIQASPQIMPVVYDYFKNNKDNPKAFTEAGLVALGQQVATLIPMGSKIKYRPTTSKGSLSKIAEENTAQTKMDVTPETKKANTPDQVISDYKPVEPIIENTTKTTDKVISKNKPVEPKLSEDILLSDAKKYKNKDDFITAYSQIPFSQSFSFTNKLTNESESKLPMDKKNIYHGTNPLNIDKILNSGGLKPRISQFDTLGENVISLSRNKNIAETQGGTIVFEIPNKSVKTYEGSSRDAVQGDYIDGFEVRTSNDIPTSKIKRAYIYLKKGQDLSSPVQNVRVKDRFGNTEIYDVDTYGGIKNKLENKGIEVVVLDEGLSSDKLGEIFDRSKGTVEPIIENTTKTLSDIAKETASIDKYTLRDANSEPKFLETNPTAEQGLQANIYIKRHNEGIGNVADSLMQDNILTNEQKQILSDTILNDVEAGLSPEKGTEGIQYVGIDNTPGNIQTEGAPNIEPTGGNKPPTVYDTELGNIMNSLGIGKDVFVSKSLSTASKLGSIGGYLEKGMKKVGDQVINLRNLTQSARNSAPVFANKILEIAGLDKTKIDLGRKFTPKESDFVGGITPNEKTPITSYSQVAGAVRTSIPDSIKNFIGKENVERTKNLVDAESVYMVNKGNKAKLDELFTPEEQARFAASEKLSKDVPQEMQQFLLSNELIKSKQLTDDYVRFVQSEYGRKILSDPVYIDINGKKYKFENIESAMNSAQARRFSGDPKISDSMEAQLASHLKAKGENLDLLRVHSPTIQLISYAQSIGNMLQNKATIDNFREFMKRDENKKITDPQAFEFIAKLFPEQGQSEILNNMIHVYGRENTTTAKNLERMADATRISSAAILALNVHTFIQPFYSTIPKGLMLKAAKRYSKFGHPVDTFDKNSTQTNEILSANGFVSPMEQFDTSNATKSSKLLSEIAAESSGRSSEQAAKKLYVLADMAEVLKRNGVKDITSEPLSIAQAWEKWARDPKNKDQYLIEQNRIHDNLGWMGESNIMNKSMFDIVRKTNLQALQGYSNSQVNKAMTDFGKLTTYIESSGDQKKAAAARTIAGILPYAATAGAVFAYLQSQNPDADPSELFWLSLSAANKMSGNVFSQAYALLSGQTSTPVTTIIPIATDLLGMIWSGMAQDGTFMQRADKLVTDVNKSVGGLTALNEITGGGFKQMQSDMLGTANTEDLTRTGKARGTRIGSLKEGLERTVGLNTDTLISNYMYGKVSDAEFAKKIGVDDPSLSYILTKTASTAQGLRDGLVRPVQEFIDGMLLKTDTIDYGALTNINTVYGKLSPDDTTESYLTKLGVSKDLAPVINSEIQKLFESEAGNTAGMGTANKLGGIVSDTPGYTTNSQAPLGKRLEEIRTKNPKLFNDIVASFGRLYGMNQEGTIPVDVRNIDTIKSQIFKDSNMQEDAAISAVTGDNPNSTALSQSITNAYQDISKDDTTLEQKVKSLKVLDGIFSGVYNAGAMAQGIERSIALESFKLLDSLKKEMKYSGLKGVQDIIASTPNILKAIKNGLTYRGFTTITPTEGTPTDQPASQVPAPAQGSLSAIASSMYGQKAPKWKNVDYKPAKIEPLIKPTKSMSLSELAKSQSSKSPTRKK